jgi:sigma-B regulation protein RsbQ
LFIFIASFMESNPVSFDMKISGNLSSDSTLLFSDLFNLFPHSFQNIISHFESSYRIVTYTDSGFDTNMSDNQLRHSNLSLYANDLVAKLEENKISSIIYVAHSVNALLAFTAGTQAPHLFDNIILTNAVPYLKQDTRTQYSCGFQESNLDGLFTSLIHKKNDDNYTSHQNTAVQLTDVLTDAFAKMNYENAQAIFNLLLTTDCRKYLSNFQIPTLILQASADKISTPEAGFYMYRTIPNSQLIKIRAKGHLPQATAPEEIIQAINIFTLLPV